MACKAEEKEETQEIDCLSVNSICGCVCMWENASNIFLLVCQIYPF